MQYDVFDLPYMSTQLRELTERKAELANAAAAGSAQLHLESLIKDTIRVTDDIFNVLMDQERRLRRIEGQPTRPDPFADLEDSERGSPSDDPSTP